VLDVRETKDNLRTRFPADRKPYTNDYAYADDSDLEDDESDDEDDILDDEPVPLQRRSRRIIPTLSLLKPRTRGATNL
jgi:hypothetical protein